MNKVYILGGAQTDFERNWSKEGKGVIALLREIIDDALKEIGINYEDIVRLNRENKIACFIGNFAAEYFINQGHLGGLLTEVEPAFYGVPCARYEAACASGSVAIDAAMTKIKAGEYEVVLVVGFELMKTVDSQLCGDFLGRAALYEYEAKGVEFPFPKLFGKLAEETIKKYELDKDRYLDNLAEIAVINYENAKFNPKAQTRKWFMNKKQASTKGTISNNNIGGLLAISDCSQVTDGAAVLALASEKFIKENNLQGNYPIIKGYGHSVAPMRFQDKLDYSFESDYILPFTRQAIVQAYKRANMTVEDIDFFETHDCFTSSEYMAISAFGITEPGKEFLAIENGRISRDGDKPINISGGLIGCGHPVGATGVRMMLDLYNQISADTGGGYLLRGVKNGMMLNLGGTATTNYAFIVGEDWK